jgi:hypothetical protein
MLKDLKQVSQVPPIVQVDRDGEVITAQLEFYLIRRKDIYHIPYELREKHIIGKTGGNTLYLITKSLYDMIISAGGGTEPLTVRDKAKINL